MSLTLVGEEIDSREIQGDEGLADFVRKYTDIRAPLKGVIFPQVVSGFKNALNRKQIAIRKNLERLARTIALPSERKSIDEAVTASVRNYICSEFGANYDLISQNLFTLKRGEAITVKGRYGEKKDIVYELPLFANARFGGSGELWVNVVHAESEGSEYKISAEAAVPPISEEVKTKAKKARKEYMDICARTLDKPIIGDILQRDIESKAANLDMFIYWIPSYEELNLKVEKIKDKDPILIAALYDRNYLVAKWDVAGEKPFEHYLQEFTELKA